MEGIIRDAVMNNNKGNKEQNKSNKYSKSKTHLNIDDTFTDRSYSFRVNWMKDEKLLNQLKKDNIDIELFQCEFKRDTNQKNHKTMKSRLLLFLQSNPIQIIIALLVLVDAGIVIAEIILEIHSLKNSLEAHQEQITHTIIFVNKTFRSQIAHLKIDSHNDKISFMEDVLKTLNEQNFNCSSLVKTKQNNSNEHHFRIKRGVKKTYEPKKQNLLGNIHNSTSTTSHKVSEKKHTSQTLHVVSETLHYASITILGLFVLEVTLKIACVGCKFFKAKFELIDAVVIVTSFVADIIIVTVGSQEISVMIIFLLWRIVRVINGLLMHEKQRDEFRIALQKKARRVSEMKVEQLTIQTEMQEKHIMALEDCSREAGVPEIIIKRCRPKYIQYTKDQTNNPLKSIAAMTTGFMGGLVGAQHSNKEINRFAASYSPSCTPRNRSPQLNRKLKNSSPSWTDLAGSNNNISQVSHLKTPVLQHQSAVNWCSSVNSVFDNSNYKEENTEELENDSDQDTTLNHSKNIKSKKLLKECLESVHSPIRDFTNHSIASPYIEDSLADSSECASTNFSFTSEDNIDNRKFLFRCTHHISSDTTLVPSNDKGFNIVSKFTDYV